MTQYNDSPRSTALALAVEYTKETQKTPREITEIAEVFANFLFTGRA